MDHSPSICWFRLDLRLDDNPALTAAASRGGPVIPVFIWSPEEEAPWQPGAASRWWLHYSLEKLDGQLCKLDSRLIIRRGQTVAALHELATETGARQVFFNRRYEPILARRDEALVATLGKHSIDAHSFLDNLLFDPTKIQNRSGKPFQVFTPFWKTCLSRDEPAEPLPRVTKLRASAKWPTTLALDDLDLLPKIDWAAGMRDAWQPGSAGARTALDKFCNTALTSYQEGRDRPDQAGTSRLSPHLHFGELSPRQVWHKIKQTTGRGSGKLSLKAEPYLRQLGWREFAHYLLHYFPHTDREALRTEFEYFPWEQNADWLRRWQRGQTGFPYIDAGMRQLWSTGWMHNRVRMAVASFLVKDLLLSWTEGAKWFWDTLVDADLANNTLGWQWTAGCGADAAPYFRVFNPVMQGEKFDPAGEYVRRWVPELRELPSKWIHSPWEAPPLILQSAGVELGKNYPRPVVDHNEARLRALEALKTIRK